MSLLNATLYLDGGACFKVGYLKTWKQNGNYLHSSKSQGVSVILCVWLVWNDPLNFKSPHLCGCACTLFLFPVATDKPMGQLWEGGPAVAHPEDRKSQIYVHLGHMVTCPYKRMGFLRQSEWKGWLRVTGLMFFTVEKRDLDFSALQFFQLQWRVSDNAAVGTGTTKSVWNWLLCSTASTFTTGTVNVLWNHFSYYSGYHMIIIMQEQSIFSVRINISLPFEKACFTRSSLMCFWLGEVQSYIFGQS